MDKEMPEEIEGYDKGDTFCKICKSEEHTHYQLVKHYHKYHKNKAPFVCNKYGKDFSELKVTIAMWNATIWKRKLNARIIHVHKHLVQN